MVFRIALATPRHVPEVEGGAENLWRGLEASLNALPGVEAEWVRMPSPERSLQEVLSSYRQFAAADFSAYDQVIATKYPGWAVHHPNLVVCLQHTLRGLYDTYPPQLGQHFALAGVPQPDDWPSEPLALADYLLALLDREGGRHPSLHDFPGPFARACVHALDRASFAPGRVQRFMAISQTVAQRADYFPPAIEPLVRHHPSSLDTPIEHAAQARAHTQPPPNRDILLAPSRLEAAKRFELLLQAYGRAAQGLADPPPLWVVGTGPDAARLQALAPPGVVFTGRLSEEDLAQAYARAQLVLFAPQDEDYGLVTLEAARAATPVLTTTDAGGPTELVQDGVSGLVCAPDPEAMAKALGQALSDPVRLGRMGRALQARCEGIRWPGLASDLLNLHQPPRSQVLVLNTFPSVPTNSGGRQRMQGLYGALARHLPVHLISLCHPDTAHEWLQHGPHFSEELVPAEPAFVAIEKAVSWRVGASAGDLAVGEGLGALRLFRSQIEQALPCAQCVVLSHPYAYPVLEAIFADHPELVRPLVYEAHNVEASLKAQIYKPESRGLLQVDALERRLVRAAALVTACSDQDLATLGARGLVLPNGLEPPHSQSPRAVWLTSGSTSKAIQNLQMPLRAVFMGSAHLPNREAVGLILEAMAADRRLQEAVAQGRLELLIMGSVCQMLEGLALPPGVQLLGTVSDLEKAHWLSRCHLGLNPMRSGSGTNLKMADYAAAGLVVLSTEVGARGGLWAAGRHYLAIADTGNARGLSEALLQALDLAGQHPDQMQATAQAAFEMVQAELGWPAIGLRFAQALTSQWHRWSGVRGE